MGETSWIWTALGTIAVFLLPGVVYYSRRKCCWTPAKSEQVYEALQSPTVHTARIPFERRVALALREAQAGYKTCPGCGFTNAMLSTCCVLCAAALPRKVTGLMARYADHSTEPETLSDRQMRIRRRKEWTRTVNDDGEVVWTHALDYCDGSQEVSTAYTLERWEGPMGAADADIVEVVVQDADTYPVRTIDGVSCRLKEELSSTTASLTPADNGADASTCSGVGDSIPQERLVAAVRMSLLDFPSKLANFISSVANLYNESTQELDGGWPSIRLSVDRTKLLAESLAVLACVSPAQVRHPIRINFVGEHGVDAGGVYREWFLLMNQQIIAPDTGIFVCVDQKNQSYYLNSQSKDLLGDCCMAHFLGAGRLLGRALLDGNVTGFHLALPLLKIILGLPVGFPDLEYYDPEAYKNLKWLLDNDNVDAFGLDFTVTTIAPDGQPRVHLLVPDGDTIDVTDTNKLEFIDRKLKFLLFDSVSEQLYAFLRGLYEVIPLDLLLAFDAEELDYVLSGSDEIDVDDWEAHTVSSPNLNLHPAYSSFWRSVRELNRVERQRLLQYATGSTRVPPGGFGALTSSDGQLSLFTLRGVPVGSTWGYIHSHACFNRLDVPMHRDLESMRRAMRAVVGGDASGFTTT